MLPQLQLVQVSGGTAVLRCQGLYEVKLSLKQWPYPQEVLEARKAAKQRQRKQKQQQQQQEGQTGKPASPAPAGADVLMEDAEQQQQQQKQQGHGQLERGQHREGDEGSVGAAADDHDDDEGPSIRWRWILLDAVLLPNAAERPPLRPVQLTQLLWRVQEIMAAAADAAALEAAKGTPAPVAAEAGADKAAASGPTASGAGPAPSTLTGVSGLSGGAPLQAVGQGTKRGLGLEECKADEIAAPLREMHGVLRDLAVQLLLEGVRAAAEALAAPGSRWHRHVQVEKSQLLKPGLRVAYWTSADVVLLEESSQGGQQQQQQQRGQLPGSLGRPPSRFAPAAAAGGGGGARRDKDDVWRRLIPRPAVEIGVDDDGMVQVLHVPQLSLAEAGGGGTQEVLQLQLNTHRVDIEALLLQSARVLANRQLRVVMGQLQHRLQQMGLAEECQLRLLQPSQAVAEKSTLLMQMRQLTGSGIEQQQQQQQQQVQEEEEDLTGVPERWLGKGSGVAQQQQQEVMQPLLVPDVLDLCIGGSSLMRVTYRGWSGQLVVRPGASQGGDKNLGAVAQTLQVSSTDRRLLTAWTACSVSC